MRALLDVAARECATHGFNETSINRILEQAEMNKAESICLRRQWVIDAPSALSVEPPPADIAGHRVLMRTEQYYGFCLTCRAAIEGSEPQ
jgi:Bacterial regulatory proteins, tetR family